MRPRAPRAAPAPARSARPRPRSDFRRCAFGCRKQMSWPAAPLRMPPGAKRTPCAVSHATAAGRSSTHRPTWLSGVVCTAGLPSGSIGCIRSTSTRCGALPSVQMSSSTFSRSLRKCRSAEAEHVDPQRAQAAPVARADRDLLDAEDRERTRIWSLMARPWRSNSRMTSSTASVVVPSRRRRARPRRRWRRPGCSPSSSPRSRQAARLPALPGRARRRCRPASPGIGEQEARQVGRRLERHQRLQLGGARREHAHLDLERPRWATR